MTEMSIEALQFYEQHPVEFCEDLLGLSLDRWQIAASEALRDHHFVAVRSGSGVGKSVWISAMASWMLATKPFSKVPCTAPSKHQLEDVLWGELYKRIQNSPYMQELVTWTHTKVAVKGYEPSWYAVARTARVSPDGTIAEGLQGFHAEKNLMFLVDEACHDDQTEVLTKSGWKFFKDVMPYDLLLSMNPDTLDAEYVLPTKLIRKRYVGEMLHFDSKTCNICVTPEHTMLYQSDVKRGKGKWKKATASYLSWMNGFFMPKTCNWKGDDVTTFIIPAFKDGNGQFHEERYIPMKAWCAFLGWYISEGCISGNTVDGFRITIAQRHIENSIEIINLIKSMGYDPKVYLDIVNIHDIQLVQVLKECGNGAGNKRVPDYVKELSPELISTFLSTLRLGDGFEARSGRQQYYTASLQLANDIQELIVKTGNSASLRVHDRRGEEHFAEGHWIKTKQLSYIVNQYIGGKHNYIRRGQIKKVQYDGYVYCATVEPHHTLYTRRDGWCIWSGNSGVSDAVFPAMEGSLTGQDAYAILTGNPTRLSGYFHSVFNDLKVKELYKTFHVSCYDSAFVDDRYIRMMEARYGKDHPIFQIKVLGDFPSSDVFLIFSIEDIEKMKNNKFADVGHHNTHVETEIGVDIGRTTAKSVACIRQENKIIEWSERGLRGTTTDVIEISEWVIALILAYTPSAVKIDAVGVGAGVYDIVKRLYPKITYPVIGNIPPEDSKKSRYVNLRAQGYWELREILPNVYTDKLSEAFVDELSDLRYKLKGDKILIESKEEIMKRIGRSPDYVDATVYAFLNPDLCVDKNMVFYMPRIITGLNEELVKSNIWTPSDAPATTSSRFGALHA